MRPSPVPEGSCVLATGAHGFLGRHVVNRLRSAGCRVVALVRRPPKPDRWPVPHVACDLLDRRAVHAALLRHRPDIVIHLAGFSSGADSIDAVRPAFEDNTIATANLLFALAECVPRATVVTAGTLDVDGGDGGGPRFWTPYGASKVMAEWLVRMMRRDGTGLAAVSVRIGNTYGPDDPNERRIVPHVIRSLLDGASPDLSSGTRLADWIYVDDVVEGLIAVAARAAELPASVDLGTGRLRSLREVAHLIHERVGARVPLGFGRLPDRPGNQFPADVDRTRRLTGWSPRVSLEAGLERTIDWHRAAAGAALPAVR